MARPRRKLLALALLAALPGCQVYEDYMPWTWHFERDLRTGRTVLTKESNTKWCRKPTPLRMPHALPAMGEPLTPSELASSPPPRPAGVAPLLSSPAVALATRRAARRNGARVERADKGAFQLCGEIDGRPVYRRLLPSEAVAEEIGARKLN